MAEAEYLFQTIEMAKSDEEFDIELCTTPPLAHEAAEVQEPCVYSWKVAGRRANLRSSAMRLRSARCIPPAPPSTPTSLNGSGHATPSPTTNKSAALAADEECVKSLLYILDYVPKYKKKLREQQRTDAELAELFNVVTITGSSVGTSGKSSSNILGSGGTSTRNRGISEFSRNIRRHNNKIFNIHRNHKEFYRGDRGEEDSVSAPEYDEVDFEDRTDRKQSRRERRFARFEHQERMDAIVDTFDAAMSFNDDNDA